MGAVPYIYQPLAHEFTYTPFVFCSNMLPHSMQLMCIYVCVYKCKGTVPYAHGLLALEFPPICLLHLKSSATLQATSRCQTLKSHSMSCVCVSVCTHMCSSLYAHTCAVLCIHYLTSVCLLHFQSAARPQALTFRRTHPQVFVTAGYTP